MLVEFAAPRIFLVNYENPVALLVGSQVAVDMIAVGADRTADISIVARNLNRPATAEFPDTVPGSALRIFDTQFQAVKPNMAFLIIAGDFLAFGRIRIGDDATARRKPGRGSRRLLRKDGLHNNATAHRACQSV
jgi:hypothetical protein